MKVFTRVVVALTIFWSSTLAQSPGAAARVQHSVNTQDHADAIPQHRDAIYQHQDAIDQHHDAIPQHQDAVHQHRDVIPQHRNVIPQHHDAIPQHRDAIPQHRDVTGDVKVFPCPLASDISPCVCTVLTEGLHLDCSNVTSEEQLAAVFQQEFPVKDFYEFYMNSNTAVTVLGAIFNGVTFERFHLWKTNLALVSHFALEGSQDTLRYINVYEGSLSSDSFPMHFEIYPYLEYISLNYQQFTWLPSISSQSLKTVDFYQNNIASLTPGTFDSLPNIEYLQLSFNSLTALETGTFILPNRYVEIYLSSNQINVVQPGCFVLPAQTDALSLRLEMGQNKLTTLDYDVFGDIFPYLDMIYLFGNPLECGCDIAWIVLDDTYWNKIGPYTTCADGRDIHDLDAAFYEQFC